jgi:hypothetical protein
MILEEIGELASNMQNLQSLKCPSCGAALPVSSGVDIIVCEYCGVAQQRVNVEKYMSQLTTEVYDWIKSMVPAVAAEPSLATVDPLARSQIFEQTLKPEIATMLDAINMQLIRICSGPLFLPPFVSPFPSMRSAVSIDPKKALTEAAKFQGLATFAQGEDHSGFLLQAVATAEILGYVSNVLRIYSEQGARSYRTVSKNFASAAESLSKDASRSAGSTRMRGLSSLADAATAMMEGDTLAAEKNLTDASVWLERAQTEVIRQPSLNSWYAGIKGEKLMSDSMKQLVETIKVSKSFTKGHNEALSKFQRYVSGFEAARSSTGKMLSSNENLEPETLREITGSFLDLMRAKAGNSSLNILGQGRVWVAFWSVDLSYSFETGVLFMKKGQAVQERFLVSGTCTIMPQLIFKQPQVLVTDIFSVRSESSFSDRLMGKEKTLTTGQAFNCFGAISRGPIPSSLPVMPPLCSRVEAEKLANIYLEKVRQAMGGKLRIGIPAVNQIVYVGGEINAGWLQVSQLPQPMWPYVGEEKLIANYSL